MFLTVLIICAILTVGILLGIEINQYFGKDNYWKGYEDGSNSIDELYSVARKNEYADGYDDCMKEYNIEESSHHPTPSEFLQQFEDFLNSKDNEELDDFDKGWLACERYYKDNYELNPIPMSGDLILSATSSPIADISQN